MKYKGQDPALSQAWSASFSQACLMWGGRQECNKEIFACKHVWSIANCQDISEKGSLNPQSSGNLACVYFPI